MIHIATVHWQTNKWIDVQQEYFRKHIKSPYRIYGWFNDVTSFRSNAFHYMCFEPVREHAIKLNILGDIICLSTTSESDILIFIDGDAFPIANLDSFLNEKLSTYKLAAIQRRENNGDIQPHPCFCATTVGFWREIKGDWKSGHRWQDKNGSWISDVGGNLLKQLLDYKVDWYPLLRSNKHNLHAVLFGIYDSLIYHHGAGFRHAMTRFDRARIKAKKPSTVAQRATNIREANQIHSDEIFSKIEKGEDFLKNFV